MKQISVGTGFVLAPTTEGRVWLWGKLPYGRVYFDDAVMAPAEVPGLNQVMTVVATQVAAVLKQDGTVWVWRKNEQAHFGNGKRDRDDRSRVPLRVPGVANATVLTGSMGRHFLALLKDGSLRGWGNTDGGGAGYPGDCKDRRGKGGVRGGKQLVCRAYGWHTVDLGGWFELCARMADEG